MKLIGTGLFAFASIALILSSCDSAFSPTDMSSANVKAAQTLEKDVRLAGNPITVTVDTASYGAMTAGSTVAQKLILKFSNAAIDVATLSAVKFYTLKANPATAGDVYERNAEIVPTSNVLVVGNDTIVTYSFDMSTAANISSIIEVEVKADVLTGDNGSKKLNLDNDDRVGEAAEDDYYGYLNVGSAGITVASGVQRAPRSLLTLPAMPNINTGTTSITMQLNTQKMSASVLQSVIKLQKFNLSTGVWENVTYTGSFAADAAPATTGTYTLTFAAAKDEEVYRYYVDRPYNLVESSVTTGFMAVRRYSYDNNKVGAILATKQTSADVTYNTSATYTVAVGSTIKDANNRNGAVYVAVGGIGAAGLNTATLTKDNFKLFNTSTNRFVPIASVFPIINNTITANSVCTNFIVYLDPDYNVATNTFKLFVSPSVIDRGADASSTTDDKKLGDWKAVDIATYGWKEAVTFTY